MAILTERAREPTRFGNQIRDSGRELGDGPESFPSCEHVKELS